MSALTAMRVVEVTTAAGCTHLVLEDRFTTGCRTGRFVALCEAEVITGSLTTTAQELCARCLRKANR